jgi:hypothetical protein
VAVVWKPLMVALVWRELMWLVLADTGDDAAIWAAAGLRQRGVCPVRVVGEQELAAWTVWRWGMPGCGEW